MTAASMIIHQPVKNRTPAAMEAIVLRFSPQSIHSEHLKPSRNPDIFSGQSSPARSVGPEPGVAPRGSTSLSQFHPKKQNSHRPLYTRMEQHRPRSSVVQAETGTKGGAPDREEKERWEGQREPCLQSPSLCACPGRQLHGLFLCAEFASGSRKR